MKQFFCALLILLVVNTAKSEEIDPFSVEIVYSRTHGLYYLLESLIDLPKRSPEMASDFRGRVGNWSPVAQALNKWSETYAKDEVALMRFPAVQGRTPDLGAVLEKVALQSKDADHMIEQVRPWLGPEVTDDLATALLRMEPLYEQYWWSGASLEKKKLELLADFEKADFRGGFKSAAAFYGGSLPVGTQPTLALIPMRRKIGPGKTRTRGHNSGNLQVVEVLLGSSDKGRAGVCFHEFLHSLWDGQEASEKARWQERFFGHGLVGRLAYVQLDEGLATALGNGWFSQKLGRGDPSESWYADAVIDAYGHALLPVVVKAVEEQRRPTDEELDNMVDAFQRALPDAVSSFDVVAAQWMTMSSRDEAHKSRFQDELMKMGPVRSSRVRSWENTKPVSETFTLFWLQESERQRLTERGWTQAAAEGFRDYSLRQTEKGWELAFLGDHEALFKLLRELQREGLRSTSRR